MKNKQLQKQINEYMKLTENPVNTRTEIDNDTIKTLEHIIETTIDLLDTR